MIVYDEQRIDLASVSVQSQIVSGLVVNSRRFLTPVMASDDFAKRWSPGGPWTGA